MIKRILILCSIIIITTIILNTLIQPIQTPVIRSVSHTSYASSPIVKTTTPRIKPKYTGDLRGFLKLMGTIEGLGSYQSVSKSGYLGLYQFHPRTLRILGLNVDKEAFLNDPQLQDSIMIVWMRDNAKSLRGLIKNKENSYYDGVYVTKAGILAGAHLVGPGGVLAFFYPDKYKFRTSDGNGVHVREYMIKFAKYNLRGI